MDSTRRRFLSFGGSLVLLLPFVDALDACAGDECAGAGRLRMDGSDLVVTSACASGHVHTLMITAGEMAFPPPAGVSKDTSTYEGTHYHVVVLTQSELSTLDGGGTVTKESSLVSGHAHVFTIMKP